MPSDTPGAERSKQWRKDNREANIKYHKERRAKIKAELERLRGQPTTVLESEAPAASAPTKPPALPPAGPPAFVRTGPKIEPGELRPDGLILVGGPNGPRSRLFNWSTEKWTDDLDNPASILPPETVGVERCLMCPTKTNLTPYQYTNSNRDTIKGPFCPQHFAWVKENYG